jgi:hypothetical protein
MESAERLKQKVLQEKRLANRLSWAQTRLEAAERERIWAIALAHAQGLSIRKISTATTLSSSRVHQLLHTDEADQIPEWLNSLSTEECPAEGSAVVANSYPTPSDWQRPLANEVELMHQCIGWLEQLARGEKVVVNLRAESDPNTLYVSVDQAWVLRVLKRITADLDTLSGHLSPIEKTAEASDPITAGVEHRRRLAEPEPTMSSLSQRDQRAILRETLRLPLQSKR